MIDKDLQLAILLRKSLTEVFAPQFKKLNETIKVDFVNSLKESIQKINDKEVKVELPETVIEKINTQPKIAIPETISLSKSDIEKIKQKKYTINIPDKITLNDESIKKLGELMPENDINKFTDTLIREMKGNPGKYINVRLTDSKSFSDTLRKNIVQGFNTAGLATQQFQVEIRDFLTSIDKNTAQKISTINISSNVLVGTEFVTVLESNENRQVAILVNDSDENIYLKFGADATISGGIMLNCAGGTLVEDRYTGIITAIAISGSNNLTITEY